MNMVIDIGNSLTKAAVFKDGEPIAKMVSPDLGTRELERILEKYPEIDRAIISSVRDKDYIDEPVVQALKKYIPNVILLDHTTPVPVVNRYDTPETLGRDRLAAAVGANYLYPKKNLLVMDFGTTITMDTVTAAGEYMGGNISPGARSRFRALHDYTGKLPFMELNDDIKSAGQEEVPLTGKNSADAIKAGVINGIIFEIEGYISRLKKETGDLTVIFTGGEAEFFVKKLKNTIFVCYDLVLIGLNRILEYNEIQKQTP